MPNELSDFQAPENSADNFDVAVVGAGLAGIAAAIFAARAEQGNRRVVLVDAHPGGRARTNETNGFRFNMGPRALYKGGAAALALRELGIEVTGDSPGRAGTFGLLDGQIYDFPAGASTLFRSQLLGIRGKINIGLLLGRLKKIDPTTLNDISLTEWLSNQGIPDDAKNVFHAIVRLSTYIHAPNILSAGAAIGQMQLALSHGVTYVDGGWQTIVDKLLASAETAGVTIMKARAESVERNKTEWHIATAAGSISSRNLVLATGTPQAALGLIPNLDLAGAGPVVEASCLDLGLTADPDYPIVLGIDAPMYLSNHSDAALLAPPGRAVVHAMMYLTPGDGRSADELRAGLEKFIAQAGVATELIATQRFLARMTVMGGMPTAFNGGLPGRPAVQRHESPALFLAGDWVGPTGLLADAAMASGRAAGLASAR